MSQTTKDQSLQLSRLTNISDNLKKLEQNVVLLYPLILEDRLELLLVSFGNGERVSLREVQETWVLTNVDLVVLSACETGLGSQLGNGEEILGFGYLMQNAGARATIASLWQVNDGGTQSLMNAFYAGLQTGKMSKAEALRQAQIALINGNYTALGDQRGLGAVERINTNLPSDVKTRLSHPFYWAPFILIGNGL